MHQIGPAVIPLSLLSFQFFQILKIIEKHVFHSQCPLNKNRVLDGGLNE